MSESETFLQYSPIFVIKHSQKQSSKHFFIYPADIPSMVISLTVLWILWGATFGSPNSLRTSKDSLSFWNPFRGFTSVLFGLEDTLHLYCNYKSALTFENHQWLIIPNLRYERNPRYATYFGNLCLIYTVIHYAHWSNMFVTIPLNHKPDTDCKDVT